MAIFGKKKEQKKEEVKLVQTPKAHADDKHSLLVKQAWVTEKAGDLSGLGKYVFIVDRQANKVNVKEKIESIYGVKVQDVNIIRTKGKEKRLGRSLGRTSGLKKAIVTLKEGNKIDIIPA